CQKYITSPFTF
nr:immunoglobulin light chain junction region [Macaca mulatta]MOW61980.1 immunoglobulin light chain junction region [Macaca mulatta]